MDQDLDDADDDVPETPDAPPAAVAAEPTRRWDRKLITRVAVAVLVAGIAGWFLVKAPDPERELLPGERRIVMIEPSGTIANAPVFLWRAVPGATWYDFDIAAADGFVIYAQRTGDTLHVPPTSVPYVEEREYIWTVRTRLTDGTTARGLPMRFRIVQ